MRKIREAIVASHRHDDFAVQVYIYVIRSTILLKHRPSYHPALLHLLQNLHPAIPLAAAELNEVVGYYILDLACRQDELAAAFEIRHRYGYCNHRVEPVLRALVHSNWFLYWKLKASMDEYQRRLMDSADDRVRRSALNALSNGFLKIQREYLEHATSCAWDCLKDHEKLNLTLEGEMITMRRPQRK